MENGNVVDRSEDRGGIFAGDDPFLITKSWLEEARKSEPNDPEAMALATVDAEGMPDCRMVLLKGIEPSAFLFYTNYGSAKSQQLEATGAAALLFHWKSMRRQIRIRGEVTREDGAIADEYFASRHPESRVGAWASRQSAPIMSRQELLDRADAAKAQQGAEPSRPPFWGGWRLRPTQFEFWADGEFRLHNRFRWSETEKNLWQVVRLSP